MRLEPPEGARRRAPLGARAAALPHRACEGVHRAEQRDERLGDSGYGPLIKAVHNV